MAFCSPFGYRVARRSVPAAQYFPAIQADFSPFLRMFDELEHFSPSRQSLRSWQPRFDVREEGDAYHLQGELPGVDQKDISIEFTDPTTLVVRGRTVRQSQAGSPPEAPKALEQDQTVAAAADAAAEPERSASPVSESGSSYKRPSVEEEHDEEWTEAVPTPATTATELAQPAEKAAEAPAQTAEPEQHKQQQGHYWLSERSVGTFQRTFNFAGQVDQDSVTANLKNGVLTVVVPKQQPKQPRKITVQ